MKTEPIEARKYLIDNEWLPDCFVDGFENKQYVVDNYIAEEAVEIAFSEGQSNPKIKQLEWEYLKSYYRSDSSIYKYAITHANDFKTDVGLYSLLINGEFLNYYAELNEAKQFAQADFENRVKKCLITEL